MQIQFALQAVFALYTIGAPLDAPETNADDILADSEELARLGYSTIRYHCNPEPPPPFSRLNYEECSAAIGTFNSTYPPTQQDEDEYTLTHNPAATGLTKPVFCPVTIESSPNPWSCDFVLDYFVYGARREEYSSQLKSVKEMGDSLIRKCIRKQLHFGGKVTASWGSSGLELNLQNNMHNANTNTRPTTGSTETA